MTHPERPLFQLRIESLEREAFRVVSFEAFEELSQLYSFFVVASTENLADGEIEQLAIGKPALFGIALADGETRRVAGIVVMVEGLGTTGHGHQQYRFEVAPRMAAGTLSKRNRIFQDLTLSEIVTRVLYPLGVSVRWQIGERYPRRAYCVQYQESDYHFVSRLCAEEGVFFFFEQPPFEPADAPLEREAGEAIPHETVVFADAIEHYRPLHRRYDDMPAAARRRGGRTSAPVLSVDELHAETLCFRDSDSSDDRQDQVFAFSLRRALRPKRVLLTDYEFRHPIAQIQMAAVYSPTRPDAPGAGAVVAATAEPLAGYVKISDAAAGQENHPAFSVHDHGGDYQEVDVARGTTVTRLQQQRRDAWTAAGKTWCRLLEPGRRFLLDEHATASYNRSYVVTRVAHHGQTPEATDAAAGTHDGPRVEPYRCEFQAVPSEIVVRPEAPPAWVTQVVESATVTGPPNEEIYSDAFGRIKVQFHWDLDGQRNEHSSCWLRVATSWAGNGFGVQWIPRIGMEVLVTFLGGDVDRPVVTACLYNGLHQPPFAVPEEKTKSGFRTASTPGAAGNNELSFDDAAGQEMVYLHAQRDLVERVENSHTLVVGAQPDALGGTQTVSIASDQRVSVGGNLGHTVQGSASSEVQQDASQLVGGRREVSVMGDSVEVVYGNRTSNVYGDLRQVVEGAVSTVVTAQQTYIETDQQTTVRGDQRIIVRGDLGSTTRVEANHAISSGDSIVLDAAKGIRLICGDSVIDMRPDEIVLQSPSLVFAAGDTILHRVGEAAVQLTKSEALVKAETIKLHGDKSTLRLTTDEATMHAKEAKVLAQSSALKLGSNAKLQGTKVQLASGAGDLGQSPDPNEFATEWLELNLVDRHDQPKAGFAYVVETALGYKYTGVLDKNGHARVLVDPGECHVSFPQLDKSLWEKA